MHASIIFVNKPTLCTNFSCMFISILYMFQSTMCPSSEELTVSMRYLVYVTLCGRPSGIPDSHPHRAGSPTSGRTKPVLSWSCSQAVNKPVWHIPLLCVHWKTADDGQRNHLKHVEFYSKNKFEKLVHLVGFIIRVCVMNFKVACTTLKVQ